MKPLENQTLLYDHECPLCNAYTSAFVKTGMLDKEGRQKFSEAVSNGHVNVDWDKARNEIALVNRKDNSVKYGVKALMAIISHNATCLKPLFDFKPFVAVMQQLYSFISYNRKVIVPGRTFEEKGSCTPDLNYPYRWAYILLAWLITSITLVFYSKLLAPLIPPTNFIREFLICGGQIVFQGIIVYFTRKDRCIHYLGNMMTISLAGALLLLPMIFVQQWINSELISLIYFFFVVGLMFLEHMRRVKILELPIYISATWVVYRILVLFIIL